VYEKYGLMVKVTNPEVIHYLRTNPGETNKSLIEAALRDMLGIPPQPAQRRHRGRKAFPENANAIPVKIADQYLVDHICNQKKNYGICQRHTVESAVLRYMEKKKNHAI
jgi:hypothetical protein